MAVVMIVGGAASLILGNTSLVPELAVMPLLGGVVMAYAIIAFQQTR